MRSLTRARRPFVVAIFAALAYFEVTTKDSVQDGNYGFDPLGLAAADAGTDLLPYVGNLRQVQRERGQLQLACL